ncbi:23S rRNA (guanosine(2251)-2'-O)-methyltransferase RlmB [candidate division KSB1 bacterium]|nr:23S rRNA (guanosine(2251)-2'-O)-methyltransferase RlmB [candidate division KSB1 bacterium]MBL7093397.1 23S rRNA (guanosine(2251)-2'-O)-methyltransferase RlmB [candidate division KSB1 bacterium]
MIIYGKNPVIEALESDQPVNKIYIIKGKKTPFFSNLFQSARQKGIPVRELEKNKLQELAGNSGHQGVVAVLSQVSYSEIEDIFERADEIKESPLIAILDEIQDPHNLGAIIRSAEAFGFHGIIIPKDRATGLTETVTKTSAGAVAHIPVVRVTNLARTIDELKKEGMWIAGTDHETKEFFYEADLNRSLGVVIGSEGKGIRPLIKKKCDFLVSIPMGGKVNSLNASVAAAIVFCEARSQRRGKR